SDRAAELPRLCAAVKALSSADRSSQSLVPAQHTAWPACAAEFGGRGGRVVRCGEGGAFYAKADAGFLRLRRMRTLYECVSGRKYREAAVADASDRRWE